MSDERRVEDLRRALYRPGSDEAQVRSYLAAHPADDGPVAGEAAPVLTRLQAEHASGRPERDDPRPARRLVVGVLVALLVLALPAPAGPTAPQRLPTAAAGAFSAPFAVVAPAVTTREARSGTRTLWSVLTATAPFAATNGVVVATGSGRIRVPATIDSTMAMRTPHDPLTVFVTCEGTTAGVAVFTEVQDFDAGYAAQLGTIDVPCAGVHAVRYRPPAGVLADAVLVTAPGSGRVAFSVVAGL